MRHATCQVEAMIPQSPNKARTRAAAMISQNPNKARNLPGCSHYPPELNRARDFPGCSIIPLNPIRHATCQVAAMIPQNPNKARNLLGCSDYSLEPDKARNLPGCSHNPPEKLEVHIEKQEEKGKETPKMATSGEAHYSSHGVVSVAALELTPGKKMCILYAWERGPPIVVARRKEAVTVPAGIGQKKFNITKRAKDILYARKLKPFHDGLTIDEV
ncbi:hypothetical protein B0H14DRAFT_2648479 [Mycena olivaceomarginata]|nr:hypothetical protein B0H14DRAFT_2648479 [Mycena olivaceomarginata]